MDRLGFDSYHTAEHHGTELGLAPSAIVLLSAVAQRTRRIKFGPLVYLPALYHPMRLAQEICMLDQMSRGRFQIGVGSGAVWVEQKLMDVDPDTVRERFVENRDLILQALTSDEVTHHGKTTHIEGFPMVLRPYQKPRPPIWYGPQPSRLRRLVRRERRQRRVPGRRRRLQGLVRRLSRGLGQARQGREGHPRHRPLQAHRGRRHRRGGDPHRAGRPSPAGAPRSPGCGTARACPSRSPYPTTLEDPHEGRHEHRRLAPHGGRLPGPRGGDGGAPTWSWARWCSSALAYEDALRSLELYATQVMPALPKAYGDGVTTAAVSNPLTVMAGLVPATHEPPGSPGGRRAHGSPGRARG
ncbi:MAG: LLM class flavin-dependent oxidoreductase [Caulobacteraceae bacterium]